jgi:Ni,Fe-hydrogenase maturation factor
MNEYYVRDSKPGKFKEDARTVVLFFGNPLEENDKLALDIGNILKKTPSLSKDFRFIECLKPEDFFEELTSDNVIILDVAMDITEITVLKDPDRLAFDKIHSAHQQNLSFYLKLFKNLGEIDEVFIIAVPIQGDLIKLAKDVENLLVEKLDLKP